MTRSKALGAGLLLLVFVVFAMATGIAGKVVDTVASMISGNVQVEAYLLVRRKAYEEQKNRMLGMESASADSIFLQDEIDRMKRSADEIKTVIDRLRINVKLLDRVKLIQPAFAVQ